MSCPGLHSPRIPAALGKHLELTCSEMLSRSENGAHGICHPADSPGLSPLKSAARTRSGAFDHQRCTSIAPARKVIARQLVRVALCQQPASCTHSGCRLQNVATGQPRAYPRAERGVQCVPTDWRSDRQTTVATYGNLTGLFTWKSRLRLSNAGAFPPLRSPPSTSLPSTRAVRRDCTV